MYKLKNASGPKTGTKRVMPMINGRRVRVDEVVEVDNLRPFQAYISTGQFVVVKTSRKRKTAPVTDDSSNPISPQVTKAGPEPEGITPPPKKRRRRRKKNAPSHTAQEEAPLTETSEGLSSSGINGDGGEG